MKRTCKMLVFLSLPFWSLPASPDQKPKTYDMVATANLLNALTKSNEFMAKQALKDGADPNYIGPEGSTPLKTAILNKSEAIAALLLDYGANPDLTALGPTDVAYTPLILCCWRNSTEIAQWLIDHGANVNLSFDGKSPLIHALYCGSEDMVRLLLNHNALVSTPEGQNPLLIATNDKIYDLLVEALEKQSNNKGPIIKISDS